MAIQRFEEMKVWQDARILTKNIYSLTQNKYFNKDFGLRDQIQRAAVSIMSNIAEGYERDSNKEFVKFLGYSKGSVGEVRSLLYVALDQEYISEMEFNNLKESATNISTQIANFIKYLRKRENTTK
ncbi:MAG TPA: four helix bundle protein [Bacteroidetes bacterium]|nr:four helix bundle protein [Bacteroidota bacterium]